MCHVICRISESFFFFLNILLNMSKLIGKFVSTQTQICTTACMMRATLREPQMHTLRWNLLIFQSTGWSGSYAINYKAGPEVTWISRLPSKNSPLGRCEVEFLYRCEALTEQNIWQICYFILFLSSTGCPHLFFRQTGLLSLPKPCIFSSKLFLLSVFLLPV